MDKAITNYLGSVASARSASDRCNYDQLGSKDECQAAFKLYEDALKSTSERATVDPNTNAAVAYTYALTLSHYSRKFNDVDAANKAVEVINQVAPMAGSSQLNFELTAAQARLKRGAWIKPQDMRAEGMIIEAVRALNFPRLLTAVPETSRRQARELIANAFIANRVAATEELKAQEPILPWDERLLKDIVLGAEDLVSYKLRAK